MSGTVFAFLVEDGFIYGAVNAIMGVVIVLVFMVTRVLIVPQGEFVAFAALTFASLQQGRVPGTVGLLVTLGVVAAVLELFRRRHELNLVSASRIIGLYAVIPGLIALTVYFLSGHKLGPIYDVLMTILLVAPLGPILFAIVFVPLVASSTLTLLIAAVGVHLALVGMGLFFFGPEGLRAQPIFNLTFSVGPLIVPFQGILVIVTAILIMALLSLFFARSLSGKALWASAVNRTGARLVGISVERSGSIAFGLAGLIGAITGLLLAPITTVFFDTGFVVSLKGFMAAIFGGLVSFPITVSAAIGLGIIESFASFWSSVFRDVIVFSTVIPFLVWRSYRAGASHSEEHH